MTWLAALVFMGSYFITKGPITNEANLINLTYLETATIGVLLLLRHWLLRDDILWRVIRIALPIYLLLVAQVLLVNEGRTLGYLMKLTRLYCYLVLVVLYVCCFFEWRVFFRALYWFSLASIAFAVLTAIFIPEYFSDVGYGFPRARAMLSEPSAFGPVIPLVFYYSLYRRNWPAALLALEATFFVASGTVYFVLVLAGALLLGRMVFTSRHRRAYVSALLMACVVLLLLHGQIDQAMSGTFNYDRAMGQIKAVLDFGGSTRLSSLFNYAFLFYEEGGLWFGKGLNAATVFFADVPYSCLYMVSEFSLLHAVFFAFGIVGLLVLSVVLIYTLAVVWKDGSPEMLIVFSCFLFASLLNSSGGHVLYKYVYVFVILALYRVWSLRVRGVAGRGLDRGCRTPLSVAASGR